jgi:hypothetical protein
MLNFDPLWVYADSLAALVEMLEFHKTVDQGEQGIVFPKPNIRPRMNLRAPLPDDNVSRRDLLAVVPFDAQSLGGGIAPVPGTANALLVGEKL